ncbi:hypothetical protein Vafri_15645 [Volvox africanus]|uniref:Uncharacterized protein n=1 Tax=Volvox africanus TaxID=51714 RepID=A0A8J4F5R4_9CHLO|nr:hypothetical protein Vafri_15645 [Volvox africanus]
MRMRTSTVRLSAAAARSPHFAVSVSDWVGTSATSAAVLANAASTSPPKSWSINPATTQTHTSNPNGPTAATNFISPFSSPTSPPPTSPTSSLAFFGNAALGIPDLAATAATATAATAASTSATARAAWITAATPRVAVARQLRFHYGSWHWRVYSSSSGSSSSSTATTGAGSGDAPWRGTQEAVAGHHQQLVRFIRLRQPLLPQPP